MSRDQILKELEAEFKLMKKELGFESTLDDLDTIFYIRDFVLQRGYVSKSLSRAVCSRIVETLGSWNSYLHGLIIPNPNSMISISETNLFNEKEKDEIIKLMNQIMALGNSNVLIGLTKDKEKEAKFIDNSIRFWKEILSPKLEKIIIKVNDYWNKEAGLNIK